MPLIDPSHARSSAFAQNNQAAPKFLVFERFKFIKNRKEHYRCNLGEQNHQSQENSPRRDPPVLGSLAHKSIEQLDDDGGHDQAEYESLAFIPEPRAEFLVGKVVAVFEAKLVIFERGADCLADEQQHQYVE